MCCIFFLDKFDSSHKYHLFQNSELLISLTPLQLPLPTLHEQAIVSDKCFDQKKPLALSPISCHTTQTQTAKKEATFVWDIAINIWVRGWTVLTDGNEAGRISSWVLGEEICGILWQLPWHLTYLWWGYIKMMMRGQQHIMVMPAVFSLVKHWSLLHVQLKYLGLRVA